MPGRPPGVPRPRKRTAPRRDMRSPDARDAGTRRAPGSRAVRRASARASRAATRRLQQHLRKRGYKIAVDGVMGPMTRSAYRASQKGVRPKVWNRRHGLAPKPAARTGGGGGGGRMRLGGGRVRLGGGGGGGRAGGGGAGGGGKKRKGGGGGKGQTPAQVAAARTALQFGPLIAEIERQQKRVGLEKDQNLSDIADYFGQVDEAAAAGRQANVAASEAALSDFDAAAGGLAALFGGPANAASAGAGAHALGLRAMLQGIGQSQSGFDNQLGSLLEQQESDMKLREGRYQDSLSAELADRLIQAQMDRGNALVANRAQAEMEALQKAAQRQNMALAAQEFGLRVAQTRESIASSRQNRRLQKLQFSEEMKDRASGGWRSIRSDPESMAGLRAQLLQPGFVVGPGGGLIMGPAKAINAMGDALRSLGLDPRKNREISRFRDQVFRQILAQSHARGQWRVYQIRGKRLVHTPSGTVIYTFR